MEPLVVHLSDSVTIICGDCRDVLPGLGPVDSCVTDPPYGLRFMGKAWDYDVPDTDLWRLVLAACKPGAHLLSFAGTRTQHRMAVNIEDAGFEIRDMIAWVYGCLSADTELLIDGRWEPYHKAIDKGRALCYIPDRDEYQWQTIQELVEYDYDDTAFRIRGDRTDQIVSRNHRCLIERGRGYAFALAETLEREARVPVLESVQDLLDAIPVPHEGTSGAESQLPEVRKGHDGQVEQGEIQAACRAQGTDHRLPGLRQGNMEAGRMAAEGQAVVLQQVVPGENGNGSDPHGQQVRPDGDEVSGDRIEGRAQPGMEGRRDLLSQARELQADQVRSLPSGVPADGAEGRVCDGASAVRCACAGPVPAAVGGGTPSEPRSAGQSAGESGTVLIMQSLIYSVSESNLCDLLS